MKVPLRFQVTEFDCGTVSLLNAFSYLFEREEIPAELVKAIHEYTLDCYDKNGKIGEGGTSREAIKKLARWITEFSKKKDFGVKCTRLEGREVTVDKMKDTISRGGVIFVRCYQTLEHYVIITDMDETNAYIFDPYYLDERYYDLDKEVCLIFDEPFKYNRIVKIERLFSNTVKDFALVSIESRECVLIERVEPKRKKFEELL